MNNYIISSFIKITNFVIIFFSLILLNSCSLSNFFSGEKEDNLNNFKSFEYIGINEVGVALSLNVGTQFYKNSLNTQNNLYTNEVISFSSIKNYPDKAKEILVSKNMISIKDYVNMLKIDLKGFLESGDDRQEAFDSLINQLRIRYNRGVINANNLASQIEIFETNKKHLNTSLKNIKENMSNNLKTYNVNGINKDIDDYLDIQNDYTITNLYLALSKKFLNQYVFLTNYNKDMIETLILNEDVIVKNSFVIIPKSGKETLEKLNLLYNEQKLLDKAKDLKNSTIKIGTSSYNSIRNKISDIETSSVINNISDKVSDANNFINDTNNNFLNTNSVNDNSNYSSQNTNLNSNYDSLWLFGDPFNLKNTDGIIPVYKQTGNINFGQDAFNAN